ncbi:MAG: glycosylasparaginase [Phycisphaerales bacterium]|nr:MAG: glycosylasparaginase [Phycisphaerales bacterium]
MTPPLMLTTWSFGPVGADAAFPALAQGADALDAVVHAVTAIEDDPDIDSVGVGGLPDAGGRVSLDACVMTDPDRAGAVACLRRHPNPAAVARRVMERTIHVMLVGDDADDFADAQGFAPRELLTDDARRIWEKWRSDPGAIDRDKYKGWLPPRNVEELRGVDVSARRADLSREPHHDTVGVLALDTRGRLAGACSTSGMAFKSPGRVGDSPIIGQGLYVDQTAGAACATGTGELITGVSGSFLIVELMRRGAAPLDAIRETLERIAARFTLQEEHQTAFLALRPDGAWASAALRPGFKHTITTADGSLVQPPHLVLKP